jgi:hypothetical protein
LSTLRSTSMTSTTRSSALLSQAGPALVAATGATATTTAARQLLCCMMRGRLCFRGGWEHIPVFFFGRAHCAASPVVTTPSKEVLVYQKMGATRQDAGRWQLADGRWSPHSTCSSRQPTPAPSFIRTKTSSALYKENPHKSKAQ